MISETDLDFLQAVWNRRPVFTYVFFGANIAIFVLMTLAGGTTDNEILVAFGAKTNSLINQGQYWRFVTPVFIHIGLLHLFFNSYALWIVGPQVEKLYGGARFVLLYVVTGIGGVVGSYFYRLEGISAGASGAIFGLFGVLFVFGLRYRQNVPPFFRQAVIKGVLPTILINLVIGFSIPQIDNSAHIAGLLSGMALAAVVPFERPYTSTPAVFTLLQAILLTAVAGSFFQVVRHYDGPGLSFQNVFSGWSGLIGKQSTIQNYLDALNHADDAFADSEKVLESSRNPDVSRVITRIGKSIDELKRTPSLSARADGFVSQLLKLMQDQYDLMKDIERNGMGMTEVRRARDNVDKHREIEAEIRVWVQEEGERYGIRTKASYR